MDNNSTNASYSRTAVTLHWLGAILILILLGTGFRSDMTLNPEAKATFLRIHLPVAVAVLVLTLWRLGRWWRFDQKPAPLGNAPAWQEAVAIWTHRLLYVLLLVMLGSGIALSVMSGAPDAIFGTAPMPDFLEYAPRAVHGFAATLLVALIALHAGAALFHHFVKRDATLRRMWFGKRASVP
ncbi:MAG: cytochrome b [Hyphomicrobiales bacterium]|nr:cytochrome b [Hyphomicrobiales bacterium]